VLANSPIKKSLLTQLTKFISDTLLGLISFDDIAGGVVNNIKESKDASKEFRMALKAVSQALRRTGNRGMKV